MSELRRDPLVGRWVLIAPERAGRPSDILPHDPPPRAHELCPFCPGQERYTPPEITARRPGGGDRDGPGWTVRVFPNRYPALRVEESVVREAVATFDRMSGIGAHEVIVDSPDHSRDLAELDPSQIATVLSVFRERILDLGRDSRLRSISLFKNHGSVAGTTLEHSHCQLVAMPVYHGRLREELSGALDHHQRHERCLFCDIVAEDLRGGPRLVGQNESAVALCPYAARVPFETWLLPRSHQSSFIELTNQALEDLAKLLHETMRRLNRALQHPAYNLVLHNGPLDTPPLPHYHWRLELRPYTARPGGFEWGTEVYINPTPPEEAAQFLREIAD
jgi:UDPglucose--hexose-1-phosphate uridylyltransferase